MASNILDGIRVVDWTVYQAGPMATAMLADIGAEVIHVEEREHGDLTRGNLSIAGVRLVRPAGRQVNFEEHNRNKKGIAVDLKTPQGKEVVYRLVSKADIFVTNFRKAAVDKLGMDYPTLKRHNPTLIYARVSGSGDKGPIADKASVDLLGRARSGISMASGELDGPPCSVTLGAGDRVVSLYLLNGILAALYARDKMGIGQEVLTSQLGSLIALQGTCLTVTLFQEVPAEFPRQKRSTTQVPTQNYYKCKDGKWVVLAMAELTGRRWDQLRKAIGMPDLVRDKFATWEARAKHSEELIKILDGIFATKTRNEWEQIFEQTDVFVASCKELSEVQDDPQALANDYITTWDHPAMGPIKFVGFPVKFSETPAAFHRPAPELGQHTEEILTKVCGYTWDEVTKLRDNKVV